MYHRIARETFDPWGTAVTPEHFAGHLAWLRRHRTVIALSEFVDLHERGSLPNDAIAITFDDGYRCNAEVAAPLLAKFGMPATIFLPIEWIEQQNAYWWDELEEIVLECDRDSLSIEGRTILLGRRNHKDRRWKYGSGPRTSRQAAFNEICRRLSSSDPEHVERTMRELRSQAGTHEPSSPLKRPMSPDQARRIAGPLVDFGSHTLRHAWLPSLSLAEKEAEIQTSLKRCQAIVGRRPAAFAYPFGQLDNQSRSLVAVAGYRCAVSTEDAAVDQRSQLLALPRVQIADCGVLALKQRLAGL